MRESKLQLSLLELAYKFKTTTRNISSILLRLKAEKFVDNLGPQKCEVTRGNGVKSEIKVVLWGHTGRSTTPAVIKKYDSRKEIMNFINNKHLLYTRRDIAKALDTNVASIVWWVNLLAKSGKITVLKGYDDKKGKMIDVIHTGALPCISFSTDVELGDRIMYTKNTQKGYKKEVQDIQMISELKLKDTFDCAFLKGLAL